MFWVLCDTEVGKLVDAPAVYEDVAGFDVPVDDSCFVDVGKRFQDVDHSSCELMVWKSCSAPDEFVETSFGEFHDEHGVLASGFVDEGADVVECDDIRVRELHE